MRSADDNASPADPMELLCAVLRSGENTIRGAAFGRMTNLESLIAAGFLVEQGAVSSVHCDACDQDHIATIERHPSTGKLVWRCAKVGYVEVDADDIRAFYVDLPAFIGTLGSAFAVPRRHRGEIIAGQLWRIGPAKTESRVADVWFVRDQLTTATVAEHSDRLAFSPQCDVGLLLHPGGASVTAGLSPHRFLALPLDELVSINRAGGLSVDPDALDRAIEMALPEPVPIRPGRPSGIADTRAVMEWLAERNLLPKGRNEAAKAVRENWRNVSPDTEPLSQSTINSHVTAIRDQR